MKKCIISFLLLIVSISTTLAFDSDRDFSSDPMITKVGESAANAKIAIVNDSEEEKIFVAINFPDRAASYRLANFGGYYTKELQTGTCKQIHDIKTITAADGKQKILASCGEYGYFGDTKDTDLFYVEIDPTTGAESNKIKFSAGIASSFDVDGNDVSEIHYDDKGVYSLNKYVIGSSDSLSMEIEKTESRFKVNISSVLSLPDKKLLYTFIKKGNSQKINFNIANSSDGKLIRGNEGSLAKSIVATLLNDNVVVSVHKPKFKFNWDVADYLSLRAYNLDDNNLNRYINVNMKKLIGHDPHLITGSDGNNLIMVYTDDAGSIRYHHGYLGKEGD